MRLDAAQALAERTLRHHGLADWTFRFDRALRRVGACFYRERSISLSRAFVEANEEAAVLDTVRHEVAHALAWEHDRATGHGAAWARWCRVTGAEPRRCYETQDVEMPPARYRCTVLATEVEWSAGSGANLRSGRARTRLGRGEVFERHRLTRQLRTAVEIGMVAVLDTKTGEWVGGRLPGASAASSLNR